MEKGQFLELLTGAICADDPDAWTGGSDERVFTKRDAAVAKEACINECLVRDTCLEYALSLPKEHTAIGIWAGYSRDELDQIRKARKRCSNSITETMPTPHFLIG